MLSINTNLSSLIAQNSMQTSTNKLNQAIERMSTGAKINHAKDNAANYSINTNMTTKISAYDVAADNVAMGMDMVSTASDTLSEMQNHAERLRALATQARNGTYGRQSLNAIQSEADAITKEIERLYNTAQYNGVSLLDNSDYSLPEHLQHKWGEFIAIPDFEETEGFTVKTLTEAYNEGSFDSSVKYSISNADELEKFAEMVNNSIDTTGVTFFLTNDIDLGHIDNWTPIGSSTNKFKGIFNGNGFVIDNLKGNSLFHANNGIIKNIGLKNVNIKLSSDSGGLVYSNTNEIINCFVTGSIETRSSCGGIAVFNYKDISNCYVDANLKGLYVGGLVHYTNAMLDSCYSKGQIEASLAAGGLVGEFRSGYLQNSNSYCEIKSNGDIGSLVAKITKLDTDNRPCGGTIINCRTNQRNLPIIGGAYNINSTSYASVLIPDYDMSSLLSKTSILNKTPLAIQLQIGSNGNWSSNLDITLGFVFDFGTLNNNIESDSMFSAIDDFINLLSEKQTKLGSVSNRLDSVLDEILIQHDNLVASRSTIRDADIAEVSSQYIQQQILQEATATLLASTKNIQYQNVLGLLQGLR